MRLDMRGPTLDLKTAISDRMAGRAPFGVWTPSDFLDLGPYEAVRQALARLTHAQTIRRITRGLYDKPGFNKLTDKLTNPDPRSVVDALARRDQVRMVIDGITAANDLGLSDAVPARIVIHTDGRFKPLDLGGLKIEFKKTAPSALYWAGRPAMRVVQALQWLQPTLLQDGPVVRQRLAAIFVDPSHGASIVADLKQGLAALPVWMRVFLNPLLDGSCETCQPSIRTRPRGSEAVSENQIGGLHNTPSPNSLAPTYQSDLHSPKRTRLGLAHVNRVKV
jgi:hypothetical protein